MYVSLAMCFWPSEKTILVGTPRDEMKRVASARAPSAVARGMAPAARSLEWRRDDGVRAQLSWGRPEDSPVVIFSVIFYESLIRKEVTQQKLHGSLNVWLTRKLGSQS